MAEQSMENNDTSRPPPHAYTVGYAMLPNKHDSFVQPSFLDTAARHGIRLMAIDAARPLAEQGPFDLVVHKLYDQAWRAQLEAFSALHPDVPVVDRPAAVDRVLDRFTMLDVVAGLSVASAGQLEGSVGVPRQVVVNDAAAFDDDDSAAGGLRFPLIAKPVGVDGSAASHGLRLVYRREGLRGLRAPVVLQEFVNHGGVLFKVYVVGDRAVCVTRSSLPDVPEERLFGDAAAVPFANISLRPPAENNGVEMPPVEFVGKVARELRRALGLHLINFDLIRANDGKYYILDINYCPGYSKMPGFEPVLTEFFLEMIRGARPAGDRQPRAQEDAQAEVPKKGLEAIPAPPEAELELGQVQA
jgi:inositol-1,3,4-trisphosphate 5/6-kinase/inositol-tetrakisphosphate 1-kinase